MEKETYHILIVDDHQMFIDGIHSLLIGQNKFQISHEANNGEDALDILAKHQVDILISDLNMPGMSGLETLSRIKAIKPNLPVVMITKSEEEYIMEEAIGSKIADYLIKPLNPNQILLSVKRILENKRLVSERTNISFQQGFRDLNYSINNFPNWEEWCEIYKQLVYWELEMEQTGNKSMSQVLDNQKEEANSGFGKYIEEQYETWIKDETKDRPVLSHELMKNYVLPHVSNDIPTYFVLIDNLRYDQWKIIEPIVAEFFEVEKEDMFFSILPTTTAYSRNSIFSGMTPLEMSEKYPQLWVGDDVEEGKNNFEEEWSRIQLKKQGLRDLKFSYQKIKHVSEGKALVDSINNIKNNHLNVIVYNFVDMLSHARTDMAMIRELAPDESAYRSITKSWFEHSPLLEALELISKNKCKVIISTDHGTIRVQKPIKILGDRNTNTNLRYKTGKNLNYKGDKLLDSGHPSNFMLPSANLTSRFVFAKEDRFFVYPNNYNHFVNYYKDTFQHGGISLEEVIIPVISLNSR